MEHVGTLQGKLSNKTGYLSRFLECYLLLLQVKSLLRKGQIPAACKLAQSFTLHSYEMEHLFTGQGFATEFLQFRLIGQLLLMVSFAASPSSSSSVNSFAPSALSRVDSLLQSIGETPNDDLTRLRAVLAESGERLPDTQPLLDFLAHFVPLRRDLDASTNLSGTIQSPLSNPEKPHEYIYLFPWRVELRVELLSLQSPGDIFIRVTFPNQTVQNFWPPLADFSTSGSTTILTTAIHIHTQHAWNGKDFYLLCAHLVLLCFPNSGSNYFQIRLPC